MFAPDKFFTRGLTWPHRRPAVAAAAVNTVTRNKDFDLTVCPHCGNVNESLLNIYDLPCFLPGEDLIVIVPLG